jgi:hypothetical protein
MAGDRLENNYPVVNIVKQPVLARVLFDAIVNMLMSVVLDSKRRWLSKTGGSNG